MLDITKIDGRMFELCRTAGDWLGAELVAQSLKMRWRKENKL
jgi:hypothetical protein